MCNDPCGWNSCYQNSTHTYKLPTERVAAGTATIIPTAVRMLLFLELITAAETKIADHFLFANVFDFLHDYQPVFAFSTIRWLSSFRAPLD